MTQDDIRSSVRSLVWSGEYDVGEVGERIMERLGSRNEVDGHWLLETIRSEVAAKQEAEATWPEVTDFDRLDRAYTLIEAQSIIALHRAGFTQSDGWEEVQDKDEDAGGKGSGFTGYCFYTEQDQESALNNTGLHIAFGHLSGNESKGVKVGQVLRSALEREGFIVEWDGTFNNRIFVKGFRWQRRTQW